VQEVDRLEKLLPLLGDRGYVHAYAAGRGKSHGCMIIHRESKFEKLHEHIVHFDECSLHEAVTTGEESPEVLRRLRGGSRRTNNIALMVALRKKSATASNNREAAGYIVATTHLFWHPRYVYERIRCATSLWRCPVCRRNLIGKVPSFYERFLAFRTKITSKPGLFLQEVIFSFFLK